MTIMTPVSGICLIMMDVNKENLMDWGPALGLNKNPDSFEDTVNIVDECLGEDGKGKLMDVIMIDDAGDEEMQRISIRQKLEVETRGKINEKFDVLLEKSKNIKSPLGESEAFKDLMKFLDTEVSKLTTYDPGRIANMQSKPEFAGFALEKDLSETAFATSADCQDFVIDKSGPLKDVELDGTIPGLNSLETKATSKGLIADPSCPSCHCDFTGGNPALTTAVNSMMKVKRDLRQSKRYKCNLFKGPGGTNCDPKEFVLTGNHCTKKGANGKLIMMETKEISCSYPEFVQYVKDFRKRLDVAVQELEVQTTALVPTISSQLKTLVNDELLDQLFNVVDNVNCRFIGDAYWGMVDGMCHQAARGLNEMSTSFSVLGGLVLALVILMYIVFRRVVDNINISKENSVEPVPPPAPNAVVPGDL